MGGSLVVLMIFWHCLNPQTQIQREPTPLADERGGPVVEGSVLRGWRAIRSDLRGKCPKTEAR